MPQQTDRIVEDVHDEPHIEGSRITVQFIKERVEGRGLDPKTVASRHDLDVADVYRALTYYHEHPDEMRQIEARRRERIEAGHEDPDIVTRPDDIE